MTVKVTFICDGCTSMLMQPVEGLCHAHSSVQVELDQLVPRGWILELFPEGTLLICPGCQTPEQRRMFLRIEKGTASLLPGGLVLHGDKQVR